jgi:hypothetical protein
MRVAVAAIVLSLLLAGAITQATADDVHQLALQTLDTNVKDAVKLETNAVKLLDAGNVRGAEQEIRNSKNLLDAAMGSVQALTPPSDTERWVPLTESSSSWEGLAHTMRLAYGGDAAALLTNSTSRRIALLDDALEKKRAILHLVSTELTHPQCSMLIDLRGPVEVNGVAQGGSQLSVDVACSKPVKDLIVDTPRNDVTQTAPDGGTSSIDDKSATVVEADLHGAKSGGVTMTTNPDPADGEPIYAIVVFAGSIEPFNEVM